MTHPSPRFAWTDEAAMRAFVRQHAFAQIVALVEGRLISAQAPLTFCAADLPAFHLGLGNPLTRKLDGAPVLASIIGTQFYVSPDWYGTVDQVPTWNYRLVEIEGVARRLDAVETREQLDRLSADQEALLAPKPAWTTGKMDQRTLAALERGIAGFVIDGPSFRGVAKLGQNKSDAEAAGAIEALRAIGRQDGAAEMAAAR
ncbi:FMN-binding negative transcriptional regulator [Sphingomonas sp. ASY06-1R]|uniref:FMN-binding negative transcriptional regulator n=1 Tax=Sphingomonas sp. ASY06-1R TaxID=3445771 RepID=UPI003FA1D818